VFTNLARADGVESVQSEKLEGTADQPVSGADMLGAAQFSDLDSECLGHLTFLPNHPIKGLIN